MKHLIVVLSLLATMCGTLEAEKPYVGVVDDDAKPTKELLKLLKAVGITTNGTLSDIIIKTRAWLAVPKNSQAKTTPKITESLTKIGLVAAVLPQKKKYDHTFIMGEGFENILLNFSFAWLLISETELTTHELILLPANRAANPLTKNNTAVKKLIDKFRSVLPFKKGYAWKKAPATENDFVQLVLAQLDIPKKLHLKLTWSPLPMSSNLKLPNLMKKIAHVYITTLGAPGHCLFVVGNPLIGYQDAVVARTAVQMKKLLQNSDSFDVAGPTADTRTSLSTYLDIINRWVFEEMVRFRLEKVIDKRVL